ncbi:MAG: type II secretion system protein M [Betaproteobacteria bacterium]|nr:type II secretion system protein M [Betaproteobacteria bacterium]
MKALAPWLARFERMSRREQWLLGLCLCAVTGFVGDSLWLAPLRARQASLEGVLATQQTELARVTADLEALASGGATEGDPDSRARLGQIEREIAAIDSDLRASQEHLVPPQAMGALLQALLRKDSRLELVALRTLPVTGILDPAGGDAAGAASSPTAAPEAAVEAQATRDSNIFRHGVELTLRGEYLDMLAWLDQVERLPWRMYWGRIAMDTGEAQAPLFRVTLHTLSLDRSWLRL